MTARPALLAAALALLPSGAALAHGGTPAFLRVVERGADRADVVWRVPRGFGTVEPRWPDRAHVVGEPLRLEAADGTVLRETIALPPGGLAGARIGFPGQRGGGGDVVVRVEHADGTSWNGVADPASESVTVGRGGGAGGPFPRFLGLGLRHILFGADHLLFVLGLVALVPRPWRLARTVTAFTVAHSLSLSAAVLGLAPPAAPVNAAIALSLVFLGCEMVFAARGDPRGRAATRPWAMAFGFGLLHGLGYAGALGESGLPRAALPGALLGFNLGVEAGQVGFVLLLLLLARAARQLGFGTSRAAALLPAYLVGCLGAAWTIERTLPLLGR